jgi:hypothetical protein
MSPGVFKFFGNTKVHGKIAFCYEHHAKFSFKAI